MCPNFSAPSKGVGPGAFGEPSPGQRGDRPRGPYRLCGGRVTTKVSGGSVCRVCADPRLDMIEAELVKVGTVKRALARSLGIGRMSLQRHAQLHLPERMQRAAETAKKAPAAQETLQKLADLNTLARGVFTRGYNTDNLSAAVSALRELRKIVELEGRLLGVVKEPGARINIDFTVDRDALARMAGAFLAAQQREGGALPLATVDAEVVSSSAEEDDDGEGVWRPKS